MSTYIKIQNEFFSPTFKYITLSVIFSILTFFTILSFIDIILTEEQDTFNCNLPTGLTEAAEIGSGIMFCVWFIGAIYYGVDGHKYRTGQIVKGWFTSKYRENVILCIIFIILTGLNISPIIYVEETLKCTQEPSSSLKLLGQIGSGLSLAVCAVAVIWHMHYARKDQYTYTYNNNSSTNPSWKF